MASEFARSVALGCWNASATGDQVFDSAVTEVFAIQIDRYLDLLGVARGIIMELQWPKQPHAWQMAAERFCDNYNRLCGVPARSDTKGTDDETNAAVDPDSTGGLCNPGGA